MVYDQLKTAGTFTRSEYYRVLKEKDSTIPDDSLAYALRKDLKNGIIIHIGRDLYSFPKEKHIYCHSFSAEASKIAEEINTDYPDVDFRIFELVQLNTFVNHQFAHNVILISVENTAVDYVFDSLHRSYPGQIMLKPRIKEYYRYTVENQLVLNRLPSESPKGIRIPWESRIEKILVDIAVDRFLSRIVSPGELEAIYTEAFDRYYLDLNTMFRYARRKGAYDKFKNVLKKYLPYVPEAE